MRLIKILFSIILLGTIVFLSASCSSSLTSDSSTKTGVATVRKGTITDLVTGTGNLALSHTEDLAFEMAGTVQDILVEAGQTITKDQKLVKLDTSDWDNQIKTLQKAVGSSGSPSTTSINKQPGGIIPGIGNLKGY